MCLAKAYLTGNGQRELVLEEVALMEIRDKTLCLSTIFGEKKELQAVIKTVDFQNSSIVLERPH